MALQVKVMRGLLANIPTPTAETVGEFRYCTDTKELYIVSPTDTGYENKLIGLAPDSVERIIYLDATTPITGANIITAINNTRYAGNTTYILVTENEGRGFITLSDTEISGHMIQFINSPKYYYFNTTKTDTNPISKQEVFVNATTNSVTTSKPIPYYTTNGLTGKELVSSNITKENQDPESESYKGTDIPSVNAIGTGTLIVYDKKKDPTHLNPLFSFYANSAEDKNVDLELASEAKDVAYTNPQYPAMQNLQDAMDKLLYITPSVSISGGGTYEIGSTIATTTLNWTWNKTISSQSLNQGIGSLEASVRTYTYTTPITSNTTFTITGTDGTTTKSASTSLTFNRYAYTKVTQSTVTPTSQCVKQSVLSTFASSGATFTYVVNDYIYFYTIGTGKTVQTNVLGQWADVATTYIGKVNLTQANGTVFEYDCYRIGPFIDGGTDKYRV